MAKILIIDDSSTMRSALRKVLEGEGHELLEADDGVNGLALFEKNLDSALILTDINMPNMDGIAMCEKIRQKDSGKKVIIMVVSTEGSAELKAKAKALGIVAWMTKPPQPDKLREAIRVVMKHQPQTA